MCNKQLQKFSIQPNSLYFNIYFSIRFKAGTILAVSCTWAAFERHLSGTWAVPSATPRAAKDRKNGTQQCSALLLSYPQCISRWLNDKNVVILFALCENYRQNVLSGGKLPLERFEQVLLIKYNSVILARSRTVE